MLQFKLFQPYPKLVHGVFDKQSGNVSPGYGDQMQVQKSTTAIASTLLSGAPVISVNQVNSNQIIIVDQSNIAELSPPRSADSLITQLPTVLLLLKTADCFPVFLFDPVKKVIGLIHLGWRGAVSGIHNKAINLLGQQYGSGQNDILIGIGPGICAHCFISKDRPRQNADPRWQPFISKKNEDWHVDLAGFVITELRQAGIP